MGTMLRGLVVAALVATSVVAIGGPAAAAPTIDRAEVCVDTDGTMRLTAELAEPVAGEIILRMTSDDGFFGADLERLQVNFDAATGAFTREPPIVPEIVTFGTPPNDRWEDGVVDDFTLTPLGATGAWRVEAGIPPGADAFIPGDTVFGLLVRTFDGADASVRDLPVSACSGLADLVGLLSGPSSAEPGASISASVSAQVRNEGTVATAADVAVDLVLSSDEVVPAGPAAFSATFREDALLRGGRDVVPAPIAPGETVPVDTLLGEIPADTPPGDYFLCTRTDSTDQVPESDEDDNVTCVPIRIGSAGDTSTALTDFDIEGEDDVAYELFSVLTEGRVTATLEWTGLSDTLTVDLTGRRRPSLADPTEPYASVSGTSPLTLTYDVTSSDLGRGVGWRLVVRDATGAHDALGTISITTPSDADLQADFERERVRLRSGDLWNNAARTAELLGLARASTDGVHGIISMARACSCVENLELERAGFLRQSYLAGRHAYGLILPDADPNAPSIAGLLAGLTPLEPEDKIDPAVLVGDTYDLVVQLEGGDRVPLVDNGDGTWNLFVRVADDVSGAGALLAPLVADIEPWSDRLWRVDVVPANVTDLAELDEVEWIEPGPSPVPLVDLDITRATINADATHAVRTDTAGAIVTGTDGLPLYDGIDGRGITVGIVDAGVDGSHPDIDLLNTTSGPSSHGTHVAGIATSSGSNSNGQVVVLNATTGFTVTGNAFQWRGVAPAADVFDGGSASQTTMFDNAVNNNGVDVFNESLTITVDGGYDSENSDIDRFITGDAEAPDGTDVAARPYATSAGNNGRNNDPQRGQQAGLWSVSKQMKNAVVVGNWFAASARFAGGGVLAAGSSMGPAYDGRMFPTVVAPGTFAISPSSTADTRGCAAAAAGGYGFCSGTSQASPAVTGTMALMLDAWERTYAQPLATSIDDDPPLPATLRALLAQTAQDIVSADVRGGTSSEVDGDSNLANGNDGNGRIGAPAGPDFATGFGMIDADAAVQLVLDARVEDEVTIPNRIVQGAVGQGGANEYEFLVTDTTAPIQVTLAWDDEESGPQAVASTRQLVNDLDLELVAPDGTVFYPWQLGHQVLDTDGSVLADDQQPPGTEIDPACPTTGPITTPCITIPFTPTATTATFVKPGDTGPPIAAAGTCRQALRSQPAGSTCETVFQDAVPANAFTGNGAWVARRGRDRLNPMEQVTVDVADVQAGRWTARVVGFDVRTDLQDFGLVGMPYPETPDIVVQAPDQFALPAIGRAVSFDWTVTNVGQAAIDLSETISYRILLSDDFVIDSGDVVLTDTGAQAGTITGADVESTGSITSTVTISQSDADAVLGTSGATVQDLVDAGVLVLLEVDPISSNAVLEHREINVAPLSTARPVDIVVVYDRSGSMGADVRTSIGTRRKVQILDDSAGVFFDLLRLDAGDALGVTSFAASDTTEFAFQALGTGNVALADQVSGGLTPSGGTDIREALEGALGLLPSTGVDERRRVIVFFSDGEATVGGDPSEPSFLDRFASEDVRVFSVGFGTDGGSSYTGIDTQLLQALADANDGGFARITDRPVDLDKFFVDALGGAIDWPTIIDPVGDLAGGEQVAIDVGVTEEDGQVRFVLTWDDARADLDLSLVTPSGFVIDAARVDDLDGVEMIEDAAHAIVQAELPLTSPGGSEHTGTWQMLVRNGGSATTTYAASAIARSTIRGEAVVEPPVGDRREAGEPVELSVRTRDRRGAPLGAATVTVFPRVPVVAAGDVLATAGLTAAELSAVPTSDGGDPYSDVERMVVALQQRWGTDPLPLADAPPVTVDGDGSGAFAIPYGATAVPGPYTFTTRTSFRTDDCADATRETATSISVAPSVDPAASSIRLTTDGSGTYVLDVTPRGTDGTYVGPGLRIGEDIVTFGGGTLQAVTPLVDELDGSYLQVFEAVGSGAGTVDVTVLGVALPQQRVRTDGPVLGTILPGGGSTGGTTTVTLFPASGSDLSSVLEVRLVGASLTTATTQAARLASWVPSSFLQLAVGPIGEVDGVAATSLSYDAETGELTAVFPAGIAAGTYPIVLGTVDGFDAPSSLASFTVVGDTPTPPAVQDVLELLEGVDASTDTAVLRALLRSLRELPTGPFLSAEARASAMRAVLELLLGVTDGLDAGPIEAALSLATVDGGFFAAGPVDTPTGTDVVVDLGNGVTVRFGEVTEPGVTELRVLPGPVEVESDRRGRPHVAFDVTSTAVFDGAEVTVAWPAADSFDGDADVRLFHLEAGQWVDVTVTSAPRAVTRVVTGFSLFVLLEGEASPPAPGPSCLGLPATIVGTDGDDELVGTDGRDVIFAGAGDDEVHGAGGADVICGGEGDDELEGGSGRDVLFGGPGADELYGGADADDLRGGPGDDELRGDGGADTGAGGPGTDDCDVEAPVTCEVVGGPPGGEPPGRPLSPSA